MGEAFDALAVDESVRAVVLGASGTAFCAGHDLKEMRAEPSFEYYQRLFALCSAVMLAIQRLPAPTIRSPSIRRTPGRMISPASTSSSPAALSVSTS